MNSKNLVKEPSFQNVIGFQEAVEEQKRRIKIIKRIKLTTLVVSILCGGVFLFSGSNFSGPLVSQDFIDKEKKLTKRISCYHLCLI